MGAGTWLLARPPGACVALLGAAFGCAEVGAAAGLALPACLGGNLALYSHNCMSLLSPGLSRAEQSWQEGCPSAHTHTEHKASHPSPEGLEGALASLSLSLPLLLCPSAPIPRSCSPCPCSVPQSVPLNVSLLRPFLQKATVSDLEPSCSHCKKILSILISFSHF